MDRSGLIGQSVVAKLCRLDRTVWCTTFLLFLNGLCFRFLFFVTLYVHDPFLCSYGDIPETRRRSWSYSFSFDKPFTRFHQSNQRLRDSDKIIFIFSNVPKSATERISTILLQKIPYLSNPSYYTSFDLVSHFIPFNFI